MAVDRVGLDLAVGQDVPAGDHDGEVEDLDPPSRRAGSGWSPRAAAGASAVTVCGSTAAMSRIASAVVSAVVIMPGGMTSPPTSCPDSPGSPGMPGGDPQREREHGEKRDNDQLRSGHHRCRVVVVASGVVDVIDLLDVVGVVDSLWGEDLPPTPPTRYRGGSNTSSSTSWTGRRCAATS